MRKHPPTPTHPQPLSNHYPYIQFSADGPGFLNIGLSRPCRSGQSLWVISIARDISARISAEESSRENALFIQTLLEHAPVGIRVFDGVSGECLLANQTTAAIAGGDVIAVQGQNFRELESWKECGLLKAAEEVLADGHTRTLEADMQTSFGRHAVTAYILSSFRVKGKPNLLVIGRDIIVEKQLADKNRKVEAQMLHVQKLESLGVLAGGIAHDFNNIILAILGNAELALLRLDPESQACKNLENIEKAAKRAADLAHQMLAYSGKGRFVVEQQDINALIIDMNDILKVSVSKKATIRLNLATGLPLFDGDATQIRQIIMNLVINASEAIGDENGILSITTGALECDEAYLSKIWLYDKLDAGNYVFFEIEDTGCGMNPDTLAKIFDPFFTTKFTGRGLGMAAVLGIVRGHGGAITAYSEIGKGTSFKVLLPAISKDAAEPLKESFTTKPLKGAGTVLLVDDERELITLGKDMLTELGFSVLTAENGEEALEVFRENQNEIVWVILDLTMPRLDGEQTFVQLKIIDPNVRVIISSGFSEQEVTQKFIGKGLAGFIQKPYRLIDLSQKICADNSAKV